MRKFRVQNVETGSNTGNKVDFSGTFSCHHLCYSVESVSTVGSLSEGDTSLMEKEPSKRNIIALINFFLLYRAGTHYRN
jgi:hypothetical protein